MKIGQNQRSFVDTLGLREDRGAGDVKSAAFQDIFSTANAKLTKAELETLMRSIDDMGKLLSRQMTWKSLQDYRERVRRFLEHVVKNGFTTKEKMGFDRRGRSRLYKIISQIDDMMADLAEQMVKDEKDHLEILAKIGDIRGLLVNLYIIEGKEGAMTWPVPGPVTDMLSRSLTGAVAHAYLFLGPEGSGQGRRRIILPRRFSVQARRTVPAASCSQCRRVESGNHPDLIVRRAGRQRDQDRPSAGVAKGVSLKSMENASKVYLVQEADRMTVEAANSLLKFLEEPTTPVVAILLAESKSKLLPTVISRCQVIDVSRVARRAWCESSCWRKDVRRRGRDFWRTSSRALGRRKNLRDREVCRNLALMVQLSEEIATRQGTRFITIQEKVIKPSWQSPEIEAVARLSVLGGIAICCMCALVWRRQWPQMDNWSAIARKRSSIEYGAGPHHDRYHTEDEKTIARQCQRATNA